jgi:hypothetical protein
LRDCTARERRQFAKWLDFNPNGQMLPERQTGRKSTARLDGKSA